MLVGDLIQAIREAVTDQPQVLPNAAGQIQASVVTPLGSPTLPAGTYFANYTYRTPWGETLTGGESAVLNVGAGQGIQVSGPGLPPSASVIRVYLTLAGGAAGTEQQFYETSVLPLVISAPGSAGVPPNRNSAYLPDTDGDAINASTMFRWLNDALKLASQVCGGLLDYSGVGTKSQVPQYIVPGEWKKISTLWYDGYPLAMDDAGNYFRRNAITASILASVATSLFSDRMMLEVWPQPSRTAAKTTLAADFGIADTTATLTSAAGFLLTNGFALIGTEIVSYSTITGNILNNLIRGLSGTKQALVKSGQPVQELNMFWQGWRMYAPTFQPGDSLTVVPVPVGWESLLFEYGLGRAKLAEQGVEDYAKLKDAFIKGLSDWFRSNKVTTGPRQIGEQTNTLEVLPSFGGGWIVPSLFIFIDLQKGSTLQSISLLIILTGAMAWINRNLFTRFVTRGLAQFFTLVSQTTQTEEGSTICFKATSITTKENMNGLLNFTLRGCNRLSKFLKNVHFKAGKAEKGSGFANLEHRDINYSISRRAETDQGFATDDHNQKKQNKNSGKQINGNFPTQNLALVILKALKNGTRILTRKPKSAAAQDWHLGQG